VAGAPGRFVRLIAQKNSGNTPSIPGAFWDFECRKGLGTIQIRSADKPHDFYRDIDY